MKINDLMKALEERMPLAFQEEYDNSGLLVGDPEAEVSSALLTVDVTTRVIEEAIHLGCNLVLAHHPVMFHSVKRIVTGKGESDLLVRAIQNNIAIAAMHTNLDNSFFGLNHLLLTKLELTDPSVLRPFSSTLAKLVTFIPLEHAEKVRQALFDAGAGHIGNYDACSFNLPGEGTFRALGNAKPFVGKLNELHREPEVRVEVVFPIHLKDSILRSLKTAHPYEEVAFDLYPLINDYPGAGAGMKGFLQPPVGELEFLQRLKSLKEVSVVRHSALRGKPVSSVAICTGSGAFLIPDAIQKGADVLVTADLKYHDFLMAEGKILLCDIGHYESEHWAKELLKVILNEKFPNFAVFISEMNTNPVYYL